MMVIYMKIGVFADTHIGRRSPRSVGRLRYEALNYAFKEALKIFVDEDVDYIIHAGDLFERQRPSPNDSRFVKYMLHNTFTELGKKGRSVKMFIIRGNHDGTLESNGLEYILHPLADYIVFLGDKILRGEEEYYSDEYITVSGVSFHYSLDKKFGDRVDLIKKSLDNGDGLKILVGHYFIKEMMPNVPWTEGQRAISTDILRDLPCNLIIFGHQHDHAKPKVINGKTLIVPGSTDAIELRSTPPFGVYIVKFNGDSVESVSFREIKPMYDVRNVYVDSKGANWGKDKYLNKALEAIRELSKSDREAIVRIVLKGFTEDNPLDIGSGFWSAVNKVEHDNVHIVFENRVRRLSKGVSGDLRHGKMYFLRQAFQPFGEYVDDAVAISKDVEEALESEASGTTRLLQPRIRSMYEDKWINLLNKVVGEEDED